MTLPVMEPGLDASILETWSRRIDDGPFSSLCFGERMAFDNPHALPDARVLAGISEETDRPLGFRTTAQVAHEQGLSATVLSDETIRRALARLEVGWKRAKRWLTSPDPDYARKKVAATA